MARTTLDRMTQARWDSLSEHERDMLRDLSHLSPQLRECEGWRVEFIDGDGGKRRFIVERSAGWRPIHLEIDKRTR